MHACLNLFHLHFFYHSPILVSWRPFALSRFIAAFVSLIAGEARSNSKVSNSMKRTQIWHFQGLLVLECFLVFPIANGVQNKEETTIPLPTFSPPEGNSTFIGGTTWCVAFPWAPQTDLQTALDWACGLGKADCSPIQPGGSCFQPNTLVSHASYAFNTFYQQNGNNEIACHFGGTSTLINHNPSYGKCHYAVSEPTSSAALEIIYVYRKTASILLLLFFTIYCY